jgi:hypothetical protein
MMVLYANIGFKVRHLDLVCYQKPDLNAGDPFPL